MKERGIIRLLVLLASALAFAGFLTSCAPGGGDGEFEEKATAPQRATTEEQAQSEKTTSPKAETKGKAKAEAGKKAKVEPEAEPEAEAASSGVTPSSPAGSGKEDNSGRTLVTVMRVVDGDTVDIAPAVEGKDRVRLIGVDTPETKDPDCGVQPYGSQASAFTQSQLGGEEVELEFDVEKTDRYDRLLAYVHDDGAMFNETLLEEGYAQVATFPPNVKYVDRFLTAQEEARAAGRGLWGLSPEELAAQTDRGNGIGGGGCTQKAAPKKAEPPKKATPEKEIAPPPSEPAPKPTPKTPATPGFPPGGDKDCKDFSSKEEVQQSIAAGDPHGLDKDGDGKGCESRFR